MSRRAAPALVPNAAVLGAFSDERLMGRTFGGESFALWRGLLAAVLGEPCPGDVDEAGVLAVLGRETWPTSPCRAAWLALGRRAGKSLTLAGLLVALAGLRDYRRHLAVGESATFMLLAADRRQARVALRYARGLLQASPLLAPLVVNETAESITLSNGNVIEIHTRSHRTTRGYSLGAALLDEIAFWHSDEFSASPDVEIVNALRPALATLPGALLLGASSPHARRGVLWTAYRRSRGPDPDDEVLVAQGATRTFNATVPERIVAQALAEDEARARAEWLGEFRSDVETFLSAEVLDGLTASGRKELAPIPGQHYCGFTDPSGGASDSMTLAIAHREPSGRVVLDATREIRAPFSPEVAVEAFAVTLKSFGLWRVVGDRYAGSWPSERFAAHGITYVPASDPKSDLYNAFLPLAMSGSVELLDDARLRAQFTTLERRTVRGGRSAVDHPPHGRDDLCNAVAGACVLAAKRESIKVGTADLPFAW